MGFPFASKGAHPLFILLIFAGENSPAPFEAKYLFFQYLDLTTSQDGISPLGNGLSIRSPLFQRLNKFFNSGLGLFGLFLLAGTSPQTSSHMATLGAN